MQVLVLADTHIRADRRHTLPDEVWEAAADADVILHAGDVVDRWLLDELAAHAPVHAVLGNNDGALAGELPEVLVLELDGVRVGMVHDSGPRAGRPGRLRRMFPSADLVVYGHSHLPDDSLGSGGQLLFNPGSCTERRRAPTRTYGRLDLVAGEVRAHRIVELA